MIQKIKNSPFLSNTVITVTAIFVSSVLNYIYQIYFGKKLSKEDYSSLQALFNFIYFFNVPLYVIQNSVSFFVADYIGKNEQKYLPVLFKRITTLFLQIALVFLLIFSLLSSYISTFLNMNSSIPIIILGAFLCTYLLIPINRGILQGHLKFIPFSLSFVIESIIRLFFGLIFINLNGAMLACLISGIFVYLLTLKQAKNVLVKYEKSNQIPSRYEFIGYLIPTILAYGFLTASYTFDVIMVKHYLNPEEAGTYMVFSLLGKVIFWLLNPIVHVLFPFVTMQKKNLNKSLHYLKKALQLTVLIGILPLISYFAFPSLILKILFPFYPEAAPYLGTFGLIMFSVAVSYLIINYHLSVQNQKIFLLPLFFFLIEAFLLVFSHSTLKGILYIVSITQGGLLLSLVATILIAINKQKSTKNE